VRSTDVAGLNSVRMWPTGDRSRGNCADAKLKPAGGPAPWPAEHRPARRGQRYPIVL